MAQISIKNLTSQKNGASEQRAFCQFFAALDTAAFLHFFLANTKGKLEFSEL